MRNKEKSLGLILLLSISVLLHSFLAVASNESEPIEPELIASTPIIVSTENVKFIDRSTVFENGEASIKWKILVRWYRGDIEDGEVIGYAWQYVRGFRFENGVHDLYGFGEFTSNVPELGGGFNYFIANIFDPATGEISDFRMYVYGGTGKFLGLRGPVTSPAFPYFHMNLNYNPWE